MSKLLQVLGLYRLTFGQPRQENLIETFKTIQLAPEKLEMLKEMLMVNLSPIVFNDQANSNKPDQNLIDDEVKEVLSI